MIAKIIQNFEGRTWVYLQDWTKSHGG